MHLIMREKRLTASFAYPNISALLPMPLTATLNVL